MNATLADPAYNTSTSTSTMQQLPSRSSDLNKYGNYCTSIANDSFTSPLWSHDRLHLSESSTSTFLMSSNGTINEKAVVRTVFFALLRMWPLPLATEAQALN